MSTNIAIDGSSAKPNWLFEMPRIDELRIREISRSAARQHIASRADFELMALAYQANLTRVASFMMAREVSMRHMSPASAPCAPACSPCI